MDSPHTSRRCALLFFLCLNCFYLLTSTGRVRTMDEYLTLFETESLVLRQSMAVPQAVAAKNFYGKYDRNQQPRAPYPPGHALAAAPWYAAGRYALARLPGVPADGFDRWFVFLAKGGVARPTLGGLGALMALGLVASGWGLVRCAARETG